MPRPTIFLAILLAVITVFSGCADNGQKQDQPDPNPNKQAQNSTSTPTSTQATTTPKEDLPVWPDKEFTEEDYEGWKTYTHEDLGYRIKYPSDWTINACDEKCTTKEVIINPPDAEKFISYVSISLDGRSIKKIKQIYTDSDGKLRKIDPSYKPNIANKIIFSGLSCMQFVSQDKNRRSIVIPYNNTTYLVSTDKDKNNLVKQILASFEFIE